MSKYVTKNADGKEEVQVDGFVTQETVRQFAFNRGEMKDVTASMAAKIGATGKNTYIIPISLKYPDDTVAQRMLICSNVLQVRESFVNKSGESRYGNSYVLIGIHESIIDQLLADMDTQGAKVNHSKLTLQEGHYWINVNIGNDDGRAKSIFKVIEGDSIKSVPIAGLMDNLRRVSKNNLITHCWCELRLKCQVPHVLNSIASHTEWNLGVSLVDAYLVDLTSVVGPVAGTNSSSQTYADDDFFNPSSDLSSLLKTLRI